MSECMSRAPSCENFLVLLVVCMTSARELLSSHQVGNDASRMLALASKRLWLVRKLRKLGMFISVLRSCPRHKAPQSSGTQLAALPRSRGNPRHLLSPCSKSHDLQPCVQRGQQQQLLQQSGLAASNMPALPLP